MFNRILVSLDGSPLAEQILPYVVEQASRFEAQVVLLRVVTLSSTVTMAPVPETGMGGPSGPIIQEEMEWEEKEARAYLADTAQRLRDKGLEAETVVLSGMPGEMIVRFAADNDIDLIAIATHGHGGMGRLVFGSVADHVIRNSGIPLLVVKPTEPKASSE
ncbi:MAG: universal stress protein [Chloroflexota bacterium]